MYTCTERTKKSKFDEKRMQKSIKSAFRACIHAQNKHRLHSFWQTEEVKPIPGQRLGYRGGQIDPRLTPGFVANGNL